MTIESRIAAALREPSPAEIASADLIVHCMATRAGRIWLGINPRQRTPDGATRSLGTKWTEDCGSATRKNWTRVERITYERNCAERDRLEIGGTHA